MKYVNSKDFDKAIEAFLSRSLPKHEEAKSDEFQIGSGTGTGLAGKFMGGKKEEETPPIKDAKPEAFDF